MFAQRNLQNLQVLILREDNTLHTGYILTRPWEMMAGSTELSSRRYNNTTAPAAGSTTLTGTNFRPAIAFVHTYAIDAEILDIATPGITCYNTPQTLSVYLYNAGTSSIAAGAAAVTVKVGGANTYSGTQNNTGAIASGAFEIINFTGINLNNAGTNIITAYVTLAGDGTTFGDTLVTASVTASSCQPSPCGRCRSHADTLPVFNYAEVINIDQLWTVQTEVIPTGYDQPAGTRAPATSSTCSTAIVAPARSVIPAACSAIVSASPATARHLWLSMVMIIFSRPTSIVSIFPYQPIRGYLDARRTRFQRPDATAAIGVEDRIS